MDIAEKLKHRAKRKAKTEENDRFEQEFRYIEQNAYKKAKAIRGEPISDLCEQRRVHHFGIFLELEDQMCDWIP